MMNVIHRLILSLVFSVSVTAFGASGISTYFNPIKITQSGNDAIETSREDYVLMEQYLKDAIELDPSLAKEAPAVGLAVAEIYLRNRDYQEAIWALDRTGNYAEAEKLAEVYENFLKTAEIVRIQSLGEGITGSALVEFKNGLRAVLKQVDPEVPKSNEYEVWTYELDRKLGFNLTPATVMRTIGGFNYAIMGFIEEAKWSNVNMRDYVNPNYPDIYLLDFLIGHADRHERNSMFAKNGRLFGIDNGRIGLLEYKEKFDSRISPSEQILQNILRLPVDENLERFSRRDRVNLDFLVDQIKIVKSLFPAWNSRVKSRPHSKQDRLTLTSPQHKADSSYLKSVTEFKDKILNRSVSQEVKSLMSKSAISVNKDLLEVFLMRPEKMEALIKGNNQSEIRRIYETVQTSETIKLIFIRNLLQDNEPLNPELSREIGAMLAKEPALFPEMFQYPAYAMKLVPFSKELELGFKEFVHGLENSSFQKSDLISKYIQILLRNASEPEKSVNAVLDFLVYTGMEKMVRSIPQTLKVGGSAGGRFWNMYAAHDTRGYFPIGLLETYFTAKDLSPAEIAEFRKKIGYITENSTAKSVLERIESSPRRAALLQAYKDAIPKDKWGVMAVAYLESRLTKNLTFEAALTVYSEVITKVSAQSLSAVSYVLESKYPKQAWRPKLLALLRIDPIAAQKEIKSYYDYHRDRVDPALFTTEPASLKDFLIQGLKKPKVLKCEVLF